MTATMPFGKFRNQPLTALDDPYLLWLLCLEDMRDPLLSAVNGEADRRMAETKQRQFAFTVTT